jgi:hypothetical protein
MHDMMKRRVKNIYFPFLHPFHALYRIAPRPFCAYCIRSHGRRNQLILDESHSTNFNSNLHYQHVCVLRRQQTTGSKPIVLILTPS